MTILHEFSAALHANYAADKVRDHDFCPSRSAPIHQVQHVHTPPSSSESRKPMLSYDDCAVFWWTSFAWAKRQHVALNQSLGQAATRSLHACPSSLSSASWTMNVSSNDCHGSWSTSHIVCFLDTATYHVPFRRQAREPSSRRPGRERCGLSRTGLIELSHHAAEQQFGDANNLARAEDVIMPTAAHDWVRQMSTAVVIVERASNMEVKSQRRDGPG
jgi:hypothetical protein